MSAATLRWDPVQQLACTNGIAQYLENIGEAMETPLGLEGSSLTVWSRTLNSVMPVNSILAGDVLDTQRRRRDRAVEAYTAASYPPA